MNNQTKDVILFTLKKMQRKLSWHQKSEDVRNALKLFDVLLVEIYSKNSTSMSSVHGTYDIDINDTANESIDSSYSREQYTKKISEEIENQIQNRNENENENANENEDENDKEIENSKKQPPIIFSEMQLPSNEHELRHLKIDLSLLCKKCLELYINNKLNINRWMAATHRLIDRSVRKESQRKSRKQSMTQKRVSMALVKEKERRDSRRISLQSSSAENGRTDQFKRVSAFQSVHGVPCWPIGHRIQSSMTRIGLELHALKDLQDMIEVKENDKLMAELNELYDKMYELWETLKARKLGREAKALLVHKLSNQYNDQNIEKAFGCPWAKKEIIEMDQQRISDHKRVAYWDRLSEAIKMNSCQMRKIRSTCISVDYDKYDQKLSGLMGDDIYTNVDFESTASGNLLNVKEVVMEDDKAHVIQRKCFSKGLSLRNDLELKQNEINSLLECDNNTIDELEKDIRGMLIDINKHDLDLSDSGLAKCVVYIPAVYFE